MIELLKEGSLSSLQNSLKMDGFKVYLGTTFGATIIN